MNHEVVLIQLEELAERLGIAVRRENVNTADVSFPGGLCRLNGKHILFVHPRLSSKEKIQVMIKALTSFDLSDIYLKPALRELLEQRKES